jgi:adenylate kinase
MQAPRVIVLVGPQGSGKGTQADAICARLGIPNVSVGQLLRREADLGTPLGLRIGSTLAEGERVDTHVVDQLVDAHLDIQDLSSGALFDGYPRAVEQVPSLDAALARRGLAVTDVLHIDIPDAETRRRLAGRRVCGNPACAAKYHVDVLPPKVAGVCDRCGGALVVRADDVPEAIDRRLAIYRRDTMPVLAAYRERRVVRDVDGVGEITEITRRTFVALGIAPLQ